MTNLNLQQGSNVEIVNNAILNKLYEVATSNGIQSCNLEGNLLTPHCLRSVYDYFTGNVSGDIKRFPDLSINVTDGIYVDFIDLVIANYWSNSSYGNGEGITEASAASVTTWPKRETATNTSSELFYNYNPETNTLLNNGRYAFFKDTSITSFNELGKFTNITTIPTSIFRGSSLLYINLSNITTIEAAAFAGADLTGIVNLPKFTTWANRGNSTKVNLDYQYFSNNPNMTEVNLASQIPAGERFTKLLPRTFLYCTGLTKVTGLTDVTFISSNVFLNCSSLTDIDIDWDKLTDIDSAAFELCNSLEIQDLSIPNLTWLGYSAFKATKIHRISNLGSITGTNSISGRNLGAFQQVTTLTEVTLPSTCKSLSPETFNGCSNLTEINGLEYLEQLGSSCLNGVPFTSLTVLNFASLQTIAQDVFANRSGRTTIRLMYFPKVVATRNANYYNNGTYYAGSFTNITADLLYFKDLQAIHPGDFAFTNVLALVINNTTPPEWHNTDDAETPANESHDKSKCFINFTVTAIYVPDSVVNTYKADPDWSTFASKIYSMNDLTQVQSESDLTSGLIALIQDYMVGTQTPTE